MTGCKQCAQLSYEYSRCGVDRDRPVCAVGGGDSKWGLFINLVEDGCPQFTRRPAKKRWWKR